MKHIYILVFCAVVYSLNDTDSQSSLRKHYGLSFRGKCEEYSKVFKCMVRCKSMGYQIHRLDRHCKCFCHEMKTTTLLPFFKWRTNGTTRRIPKTRSPRLYDIVGSRSPFPTEAETKTTDMCPTFPAWVYNLTSPKANDDGSKSLPGDNSSTSVPGAPSEPGNDTSPILPDGGTNFDNSTNANNSTNDKDNSINDNSPTKDNNSTNDKDNSINDNSPTKDNNSTNDNNPQ